MTNPWYNHVSANPVSQSRGSSGVMRTEFDAVAAGFDLLPASIPGYNSFSKRAIVGADTAISSDRAKVLTLSGTFTLGTTAAATLGAGWWCYLQNIGTGTITLDPNGAETVDGQASGSIYPGFVFLFQCDGAGFSLVKMGGQRIELVTAGVTWTAPIGIRVAKATTQGGGGSGAQAPTAGCGGSGGGVAEKSFVTSPGTAHTIAIGSGGAAVALVNTSGNPGTATTFNTNVVVVTASGGAAGSTSGGNNTTVLGGAATNGDTNTPGGTAFSIGSTSIGGDSKFGRGGAYSTSVLLSAATGYGSGGGGQPNTGSSGAGMPGCIVMEY